MAVMSDEIIKTFKDSGVTLNNGDIAVVDGINMEFKDGKFTEVPGGAGNSENKLTTPPKWDEVKDARKLSGAGKYPNYWAHKTRSGHVFMMDDSRGAESVTLQHRTGSMIQIMPDGMVHLRAQNGQHTVVFGENRMYVTGAHDITVDGSASITCKKDFNVNSKNMNFTATDGINLTAKSMNINAAQGQIDMVADSLTQKVNKTIEITSQGTISAMAEGSFAAGSTGSKTVLFAAGDFGLESKRGRLIAQSALKMSLLSTTALSIGSTTLTSIMGSIVAIDGLAQAAAVQIQSGISIPPEPQATIVLTPPTNLATSPTTMAGDFANKLVG